MNDKRIENEKRNLFNELINLTRGVKAKFSGNKKVITHNDVEIHNLLICWENIINFGLKNSILSNVQELFNSSSHNSLFWTFAYQYLSNDEKKRFNGFKNLWTDRGKTKALIRNALNESCLERYLLTWIYAENIKDYYEPFAILRDEKAEILPKLASDISCLLFAIPIDDAELNLQISSKPNVVMIEPVIESSSSSAVIKPRKINQIDCFNETTKPSSVEVNSIILPSLRSRNNYDFEETFDQVSVTSENASHSNDIKHEEEEEDLLSHSTITSDDEDDGEIDDVQVAFELKQEESKNNDAEIIQNQRDRIRELEQHIKDLTLENSRLRHLLNTNKINTAASFQVSIPRAVLQKSKTQNYYVYEINLKTTKGSENWTVFKRYRDFYKLHKSLKKEHLQIKILDFPPKKKIGNTNFDFVEDRRQRLQVYIRHVLQNLPELQVETRQLLESNCTFFKTS